MFCARCGQSIPDGAAFCPACGGPTATAPASAADPEVSPRRILPALLLCVFLGVFGAHRFYTGKVGTALLIILTFGGFFGLWPLIDAILIVVGAFRDRDGRRLTRWT